MAEGFARELGEGLVEAHSAGVIAAGVHPRAAAVMEEAGVDIWPQRSKVVDPDLLRKMDVVITLCTNADQACPATPPGVKRLHWPIRDPVGTVGSDEVIMNDFRRARDEIRERILEFLATVPLR